jgi:hypothetical protein
MPLRQVGGGSWDEYCYCCGLPFTSHTFEDDTYSLVHDRPLNQAELDILKENAKVIEPELHWLNSSIGLDSHHKMIFNLKSGGDMGDMFMEPNHRDPHAQEFYNDESTPHIFATGDIVAEMSAEDKDNQPIGLAIHSACAKVLEGAIKRPLKPSDELKLRRLKTGNSRNAGSCFKPYNDQFYSWADAALNEPLAFFKNPMSSPEQKARILSCTASFIKENKVKWHNFMTKRRSSGGKRSGSSSKRRTRKQLR